MCCRFHAEVDSLGLKKIRPMTYNTLQHGEPTSPRRYFSLTWIPHVQPLSFHVLRLKERQIHIGRTDLWARRPDTSLSSLVHRAGIVIYHVHGFR